MKQQIIGKKSGDLLYFGINGNEMKIHLPKSNIHTPSIIDLHVLLLLSNNKYL